MLRRCLISATFVGAALTVNMVPAQAFVEGPHLDVWNYYSDVAKTHLVGQRWSGCGAGEWGTRTSNVKLTAAPC